MRASSNSLRQRRGWAYTLLALIGFVATGGRIRDGKVGSARVEPAAPRTVAHEAATLTTAVAAAVREEPDAYNPLCPGGTYRGAVVLNDTNFGLLHHCVRVVGNLQIDVSRRRDLAGLETLRSIDGSLTITAQVNREGESLESMRGLDSLREIAGDLSVGPRVGAGSLLSLNGLDKLRSVRALRLQHLQELNDLQGLGALTQAASVEIVGCDALESLLGLSALREIRGRLYVAANAALVSLSGAPRLQVLDELVVDDNASLTSLHGLPVQVERLTALTIEHNAKLESLAGSEGLAVVQSMFVSANSRLTRLADFHSLRSLQSLEVADNPRLTELGTFPAFTGSDQFDLTLRNNERLSELRGLERITRAFNVTISGHSALPDLSGWYIASVHNLITVSNNASLTTLHGLERLREVALLRIQANPRLDNLDALAGLRLRAAQLELYNNLALRPLPGPDGAAR